jgi:hypothetical protein
MADEPQRKPWVVAVVGVGLAWLVILSSKVAAVETTREKDRKQIEWLERRVLDASDRVRVLAEGGQAQRAEPASEKFHCLSVGNDVARECTRSAEACRTAPSGSKGCFEQDRAFCFSAGMWRVSGPPERMTVCTPTREECTAWSNSFRRTSADSRPSACLETARREVWQ